MANIRHDYIFAEVTTVSNTMATIYEGLLADSNTTTPLHEGQLEDSIADVFAYESEEEVTVSA